MFGACQAKRDTKLKTFLGIIVDLKLCWKPHTEYIKSEPSKVISKVIRIENVLHIYKKVGFITIYCVEFGKITDLYRFQLK